MKTVLDLMLHIKINILFKTVSKINFGLEVKKIS